MKLSHCALLIFVIFFGTVNTYSTEMLESSEDEYVPSYDPNLVHEQNCSYKAGSAPKSLNAQGMREFGYTGEAKALHQQNTVWAKFHNFKYQNYSTECLMKKQLQLKINQKPSIKVSEHAPKACSLQRPAFKAHVDWSPQMRPPQNQRACGSCWAFATTSVFAFQLYKDSHIAFHNHTRDLSEQFLVDCDSSSAGCNGGFIDHALEFLDSVGYATVNDYPYRGQAGNCSIDTSKLHKSRPGTEIVNFFKSSDAELMRLLQNGPVAVGISAGNSLYYYSEGVLQNCGLKPSVDSLNHAVVLVGYGIDRETRLPFWKLQNSWGADWGEAGYFRVLRDGRCRCGMCLTPSQVVIWPESSRGAANVDFDYYDNEEYDNEPFDDTDPIVSPTTTENSAPLSGFWENLAYILRMLHPL